MNIRKAIIPAAGLGTRFLPATKAQPKEMLPIVDKPTLQYIIEEAVQSGITEILIITGRNKKAIEDHFDKSVELELELEAKGNYGLLEEVRQISNMVNIHYIRQKEPKGLGHAIYCARSFIGNEPFAVLLGDDIVHSEVPCLKQLIECYEQTQHSVLGVQKVDKSVVNKYGIVKVSDQQSLTDTHKVEELVEKPAIVDAPSNIAILGRYIIEPDIFDYIEQTTPGTNGEIQLTDALNLLVKNKPIFAHEFKGRRYDVGDKLGFLQANVEYALRKSELQEEFKAYLKTIVSEND